MDNFEGDLTKLLTRMKNYTSTEFFLEQHNINLMIKKIKDTVNNFSCYVPDFAIKMEDPKEVKEKIQEEIKTKLAAYLVQADNEFSLSNFEHVTKTMENPLLQDIYQKLGPFDYSRYMPDGSKDDDKKSDDDEDKHIF
jgi:DNA-binding protein Fis